MGVEDSLIQVDRVWLRSIVWPLICSLALFLVACGAGGSSGNKDTVAAEGLRPNILFILADDPGYTDLEHLEGK